MQTKSNQDRPRNVILTWTSSYWLMVLFAIGLGCLAIVSSFGFDWMMHGIMRPVYASDIFDGLVVTVFSAAALLKLQARRRELQARMQAIEDINHHVRNALSAVVLSASLREDPELNKLVKDACQRIDWVLKDMLPKSFKPGAAETKNGDWNPGRQLIPQQARKTPPSSAKTMRN